MAKFVLVLAILVPALVAANSEENDDEVRMYMGVPVYKMDPQCAMVGGICVPKTDCLQTTSNNGLCPSNQHKGVECCYELPIRPAPCYQHLGQCMKRCAKTLQRPATDCLGSQVCCVLV